MHTSQFILFVGLSLSVGLSAQASCPSNQFTVVSWNVDSGGADPHLTALRIFETAGVHLWGLCEVRDDRWAKLFEGAAGDDEPGRFARLLSPTRGSDRSLILYDLERFEPIRYFELDWSGEPWHTPDMALRPALIAQLRHRATGGEFFFVVNRLDPKCAARQAVKLNAWAARQSIPVIAVGTYYFQYGLHPHPLRCDGRKGLTVMTIEGVFNWVKPENPIRTYDSDAGTIEDFIFVANAVGRWHVRSHIVVEPGDFPDDQATPDHRPVRATVSIGPPIDVSSHRHRIRLEILKLQSDVDELEALVEQLPE